MILQKTLLPKKKKSLNWKKIFANCMCDKLSRIYNKCLKLHDKETNTPVKKTDKIFEYILYIKKHTWMASKHMKTCHWTNVNQDHTEIPLQTH